jgi:Ca-activated chloride channel homolog
MNFYIPALEYVIPPLLWGLLLPLLLLGLYALMQRRRAPDAVPYSGLYLPRGALQGRPSTAFRRHVPPALLLLAAALGAVALARPALRVPVPKERATIILVLDVSGSMGAQDMWPSRLDAAKRAAQTFVDTLPEGFRVGVVAFSSDASLVQPVTDDLPAASAAIGKLQLGGGTAIGEGLEVALASLPPELVAPAGSIASPGAAPNRAPLAPGQPPPPPPAVVLLLTDGENTEGVAPLDATANARDANVPVFTIGMGGRGGGFPFGGGARGSVDETLLQEMAAQTGGQYYYAPSGGDLQRIYNDLGVALGWDFERLEIGQLVGGAAVFVAGAGLVLAFLWLHRQP